MNYPEQTTAEEQRVWQEFSTALNLNLSGGLAAPADDERMAAYWDHVFGMLDDAEVSADLDAQAYALK